MNQVSPSPVFGKTAIFIFRLSKKIYVILTKFQYFGWTTYEQNFQQN